MLRWGNRLREIRHNTLDEKKTAIITTTTIPNMDKTTLVRLPFFSLALSLSLCRSVCVVIQIDYKNHRKKFQVQNQLGVLEFCYKFINFTLWTPQEIKINFRSSSKDHQTVAELAGGNGFYATRFSAPDNLFHRMLEKKRKKSLLKAFTLRAREINALIIF